MDTVLKEEVKKEMEKVDDIAITADHLTESINSQYFFGVNAQYSVDGQIVCRQLACRNVPNKKCKDSAEVTDQILKEYDVPLSKVGGYVTDLALRAAYDPTAPLPKKAKGKPREWVHKEARYKTCSRHQMAIVQKDAFNQKNGRQVKQIRDQIDICKDVVTLIKKCGIQQELKRQKGEH